MEDLLIPLLKRILNCIMNSLLAPYGTRFLAYCSAAPSFTSTDIKCTWHDVLCLSEILRFQLNNQSGLVAYGLVGASLRTGKAAASRARGTCDAGRNTVMVATATAQEPSNSVSNKVRAPSNRCIKQRDARGSFYTPI